MSQINALRGHGQGSARPQRTSARNGRTNNSSSNKHAHFKGEYSELADAIYTYGDDKQAERFNKTTDTVTFSTT